MEELRIKEATLEQKVKSLEHRVDRLEEDNTALHDMATSIQIIAVEMEHMRTDLTTMSKRIGDLESEPKERLWQVVLALIAAAIGYGFGMM